MPKQAVVLIPGFLGFDHRHGTTYFADRFIAGLRARLEGLCGGPFPVVPVTTLPIGSLAKRQADLIRQLGILNGKLGSPWWHLLGHSTGGVDAALLARTERLAYVRNASVFSGEPLQVERLASITTLSAPHYGTCLAVSPLAELVRHEPSVGGLGELLETARAAVDRDELWSRLSFLLPSLLWNPKSEFYSNFFNNQLANDLDPKLATALTNANNRRKGIVVTSFATYTPPPTEQVRDRLFRDLWRWTQEKAGDPSLPSPPPFPNSTGAVISARADIPKVDASSNDGVVNTERQVDGGGEFGALIVGDHADVLGRYRRTDLLDGTPIDPGLLTSGAEFGDDQFFQVLDRIAQSIAARAAQLPAF